MEEAPKGEKHKRISAITAGFMISIAAVIDLIQIALDLFFEAGIVVNRLIDIAFALVYGLWFMILGVPLFKENPYRFISFMGAFLGEEIPDVDVIPFWTIDVIYMILDVWSYDGKGGKLVQTLNKVAKKGRPPKLFPGTPPPLPPTLPPPLPWEND